MIAAIETAILARLKAASDAEVLGYRLKTLETYPDEWDQYLKDKGPINAPAEWVTFSAFIRSQSTCGSFTAEKTNFTPAAAPAKGSPQAAAWNIGTIGRTTARVSRSNTAGWISASAWMTLDRWV